MWYLGGKKCNHLARKLVFILCNVHRKFQLLFASVLVRKCTGHRQWQTKWFGFVFFRDQSAFVRTHQFQKSSKYDKKCMFISQIVCKLWSMLERTLDRGKTTWNWKKESQAKKDGFQDCWKGFVTMQKGSYQFCTPLFARSVTKLSYPISHSNCECFI